MDVRDYEYIVTIADQGSITRAADQLFITQPALTKFLQRIEKELGLSLFSRQGKQLVLTEAGHKYVEVGRSILKLDRKLTQELHRDARNRRNHIRLGFSMGRSQEMLGRVLPEFRRAYPDVKVTVMADTSRRQFAALKQNELDVALITNVEHLPEYTYIPVEQSYMALAVPADSPLLTLAEPEEGYPFPVIGGEYLTDLPFISLRSATNSGYLTRELLQKHDIRPNNILELSDVRSVLDTVEQGLGIAMFMSVPTGTARVRYLSVRDMDVISQTVHLVHRTDMSLSEPMRCLMSLILNK